MKTKKLFFLFSLLLVIPTAAIGATRTITVKWQMPENVIGDIQEYRLNFSTNSDMSGASPMICGQETQTGKEGNMINFTMTCTDVPITTGQIAYFTLEAVKLNGTSLLSSVFSKDTKITPVSNFKILTPSANLPPTDTEPIYINFQPADAPVPEGFKVDSGEAYNDTRGYGWVSGPASLGVRDRNNSISPNQAYDTMIHVAPNSLWEITIPNGTYNVTVCMGDPSFPEGTENVQVEGSYVIQGIPLSTNLHWIEKTVSVNVKDNKLTLTFTGSTDPARLCWIKIE